MIVGGCDSAREAAYDQSIALAESLGTSSSTRVDLHEPVGSPTVDMYVDGSQSMAGFTAGRVATLFDEVLDKITFTVGIDSLYRFGQYPGGFFERFPASSQMRQTEFYDRTNNPDQQLFSRILADTTGRAFLYITDGVLSDQGGLNQASVVNQLTSHLARGGGIGLLVFRSAFRGRAWSEQNKAWIGEADVEARPFYLFLIAPSEASLDILFTRLGSLRLSADHLYRFDRAAVSCAPLLAKKMPTEYAVPKRHWYWVPLDELEKQQREHMLTYSCDVEEDFPLTGFQADLKSTLYTWDLSAKRFRPSPETAASVRLAVSSDKTDSSEHKSEATVTTFFDLPAGRFHFLHVRAASPLGHLRPELDSLSTDSDATLEAFTRTYRLGWLVEELAHHQLQGPQVSQPLFLTLENN